MRAAREASRASSMPVVPVDAFEMKRTGSIGFARRAGGDQHALAAQLGARAARARVAATIAPRRPAARCRFRARPETRSRARRSSRRARAASRRFRRVAGCSYIAAFIAGATTSGMRAASAALVEQIVGDAVRELGDERWRSRARSPARRPRARARCAESVRAHPTARCRRGAASSAAKVSGPTNALRFVGEDRRRRRRRAARARLVSAAAL